MPFHLPPVPPVTKAGFHDPVWPRWLRTLQSRVSTSISNLVIATSNGFSGAVTHPQEDSAQVTLSTTASGMLKGLSGSLTSATPGTDYSPPLSIASANGLAGTVATVSPLSAVATLSTTVSGMVKGTAGSFSAAIPGVDYSPAPSFAAYYSDGTQSAPAITATPVTVNNLTTARNFTAPLPGSQITASTAGTYNLQFSLQLVNPGTALDDVLVWVRKNGVNVPATSSLTSVPGKHGSTDGSAIVAVNIFLDLAAGDYIELYWATLLGTTSLQTYTPLYVSAPLSPAAIITIMQVYP